MKTKCCWVIALGLMACAVAAAAEERPTRLYVRTIPPGARLVIDGKELGLSDGLFIVLPGDHTVTIELEGYAVDKRDVKVPPERITRLVVTLVERGQAGPPPGAEGEQEPVKGDQAAMDAAMTLLAREQVPEADRAAMQAVLRQHPTETRWSGRSATRLFAVAAKALPKGEIRQRATPALLELTHSLAVRELLTAKSLLDRYAEAGLADATTLRQAVLAVAGDLEVTGNVKGLIHQAAARGDFAVAYVVAEEPSLSAHLLQPAELEKVKTSYRNVMHAQARDLMERKNWREALALWRHLHERKLVSQALYLDAATCFMELKQLDDALKVLEEAYTAFSETASAEWLEQCGDLACKIGKPGEPLAVTAYESASARLRQTVTGREKQRP